MKIARSYAFLPGDEDLAATLKRFADTHEVWWLAAVPITDVVDCSCVKAGDNGCDECGYTTYVPKNRGARPPATKNHSPKAP